MTRIKLDRAEKRIKDSVRSLPITAGGAILELGDKPMLRATPVRE
jgi:hypothetical protein